MSRWASWIAQKRSRARAAGMCSTCCKRQPDEGRLVCSLCTARAREGVLRRRTTQREAAKSRHLIDAHMRAGDETYEHHLYADAAQHYQHVLNASGLTPADRLNVSSKLSYALLFGKNPTTTTPWTNPLELLHSEDRAKHAAILNFNQRARQLDIALKPGEALSVLMPMLEIGKAANDPYIVKLAHARISGCLISLNRYDEAKAHLRAVRDIHSEKDPTLRIVYHMNSGRFACALGNFKDVREHFENAARLAEKEGECYRLMSVWYNYGLSATELGNIELAKACIERALFIARQYQIAWQTAEHCLMYVYVLTKMGKYEVAHDYLLDALSCDADAPVLDEMLAEVGIPLAMHMNDQAILKKCVRPPIVETVFRSHSPNAIGPVAAAFSQYYVANGNFQSARELLRRALDAVSFLGNSWNLTLEVARHGYSADIPRARNLLKARLRLPNHSVASAYIPLFEALVAQRDNDMATMLEHAAVAVRRFEALHWYGYANFARTLLPKDVPKASAEIAFQPFAGAQAALTAREQQVAELVLKGMTNREIASQLSITKHTVDSHVASIMGRLGIRSRYQLPEALPQLDERGAVTPHRPTSH